MKIQDQILKELKAQGTAEKVKILSRFFKTGPGEYGEGDRFLGVTVPAQRVIVKKYSSRVNVDTVSALLDSDFHEARLTGVLLLVSCFSRSTKSQSREKKGTTEVVTPDQWVSLYLKKTDRINNWDLVDSSAPAIVGKWLEDKDRTLLYRLAKSKLLWDNRIAMVATQHFIRHNELDDLFKLSEQFLNHPHDLMHKATGWMLREAWKKDPGRVEAFLEKHKGLMPRTMLRYAIEKMPDWRRKQLMKKGI